MAPLNLDKMTRTEKMSSLQYLMFLSKKQCGRIKDKATKIDRSNVYIPIVMVQVLPLSPQLL
eukprot:4058655-Ditylum_brightwellii.AAC.1